MKEGHQTDNNRLLWLLADGDRCLKLYNFLLLEIGLLHESEDPEQMPQDDDSQLYSILRDGALEK